MFDDSKKAKQEPEKSLWRYFPVGLALVAAVLAFVFFSRWWENYRIDKAAQEKAEARRAEESRRAAEVMGGSRFDILAFYSYPGRIARGEKAQLCYSVSNAKSVRIEPYSGALWPAYSHCVSVTPHATTTYTLTAEDAEGHTKTATTKVQVR